MRDFKKMLNNKPKKSRSSLQRKVMLWTLSLTIMLGLVQAIIVGQLSIQKLPRAIYQELMQPTLQIQVTHQLIENGTTSNIESQGLDLEKPIQRQMVTISAVSLSAFFVIGIISSLFISHAVSKPLNNLSQQIATINAESLDTRLTCGNVDDDIATMTQEINKTLNRLESSFLSQERFVMDAAHELRTPLSILLAQNETLKKELNNGEQVFSELLAIQNTTLRRLESITEDLLFLTKGEEQFPDEDINLTQLIGEICLDLKWLSKKQQVDLIYEPKDILGISANPVLLDRLIRNIILNAIQYNKSMGKVFIDLEKRNNELSIMIRDTGIGIPEKDIPFIFDRFYRSDRSRSRKTGGTGLGLAIAKHIALRYGALFKVTSELDKGSCFIVMFPTSSL